VALTSPLPAATHLELFEFQLVASGDGLVLLTLAPDAAAAAVSVAPAQHSYLINPRTGAVQALGAVRIVPEPTAGVLFACTGLLLLRRRARRWGREEGHHTFCTGYQVDSKV
jgi:hypothetical protein